MTIRWHGWKLELQYDENLPDRAIVTATKGNLEFEVRTFSPNKAVRLAKAKVDRIQQEISKEKEEI